MRRSRRLNPAERVLHEQAKAATVTPRGRSREPDQRRGRGRRSSASSGERRAARGGRSWQAEPLGEVQNCCCSAVAKARKVPGQAKSGRRPKVSARPRRVDLATPQAAVGWGARVRRGGPRRRGGPAGAVGSRGWGQSGSGIRHALALVPLPCGGPSYRACEGARGRGRGGGKRACRSGGRSGQFMGQVGAESSRARRHWVAPGAALAGGCTWRAPGRGRNVPRTRRRGTSRRRRARGSRARS